MTNEQRARLNRVGLNPEAFEPMDKIAVLSAKLDALMEYHGLKVKAVGDGVFEVVKDEMPTGDYTNPIRIPAEGLTVTAGLWYYVDDPDLPHEALQDAFVTPEDFNDTAFFDFVA